MRKSMILLVLLLVLLNGCDPYTPETKASLAATSAPTLGITETTLPTEPSPVPTTLPGATGHIHHYVAEIVAPGCTEAGYTRHVCVCGDGFQDMPVEPLGHVWGAWLTTQPATVEQEGQQQRECGRCQVDEHRTLPRLEPEHSHAYTATVVEAGCTEVGYTMYTCSCGDRYRDGEVAALGHSWGQWATILEPTAEAEGAQMRKCGRCDATDQQSIEKLPSAHIHEYQKQKVAATCAEGGYDLYTCQCGDSYREETSAAKGHSWGTWTVDTAPTVNQAGQLVCRCEACGEAQYRATEKLPSADGFVFVLIPEMVGRNEKATVAIIGQAGVTYDIDVFYKSGESSAKGLEDQVADGQGYVCWTWKIGPSTAAGTYRIEVTGNGVTQTVYFTVVV